MLSSRLSILSLKVDYKIMYFTFKVKLFNGLKGPLSGLRQFVANESPLKMMKNVFLNSSAQRRI